MKKTTIDVRNVRPQSIICDTGDRLSMQSFIINTQTCLRSCFREPVDRNPGQNLVVSPGIGILSSREAFRRSRLTGQVGCLSVQHHWSAAWCLKHVLSVSLPIEPFRSLASVLLSSCIGCPVHVERAGTPLRWSSHDHVDMRGFTMLGEEEAEVLVI